jgi:hypothetical protein
MPLDVNGNIILSGLTNTSGIITNYPDIVKNGLVLWLDAGRSYSYYDTSYYDCGYGCQYYSSNPGCTSCANQWNDLSPSYSKGTLTNGPTFSYANGGGIVFDGTNDYVTVPHHENLNMSSTLSAGAWVYYVSGNGRILQKDDDGSSTYTRLWELGGYGGTMRMEMWHSDGTAAIGYGNALTVNGWMYLMMTFDGTNIKMYQNGTLITTVNFPGNIRTGNAPITIGGRWSTGEYFNGRISSVQIYNISLTATQVMQNFNADRGRFGI